MKKIFPFLILTASVLGLSYRAPSPMPVKMTQADLKYIAVKLKDPECVIGIFKVPDFNDPWHKLRSTGDYVENDSNYIDMVIAMRILKLDVVKTIKGDMDTSVFTKINMGGFNENETVTFYPFPGVSWLLIMNKGLINKQPAGWVKDVKDLNLNKWINPTTAFVMDGYKGNFYTSWNKKYDMPIGLTSTDMAFANDIESVNKGLKNISPDLSPEEYNAKAAIVKGKLKTEDGRKLCDMVLKK